MLPVPMVLLPFSMHSCMHSYMYPHIRRAGYGDMVLVLGGFGGQPWHMNGQALVICPSQPEQFSPLDVQIGPFQPRAVCSEAGA